jgi:cardiolipin synthase A/B
MVPGTAALGLNLAPGNQDDGWDAPEPATLDDGTRIRLFKDGEALAAAAERIASATKRIWLEVYILAPDETGRRFAQLLSEKARQGVAVHVIVDDFGCLTSTELLDSMRQAGVKVRIFHPVRPWRCSRSWRPLNRDHRKLLLVDDDTAGLGGLNIANEYAGTWVARVRGPASHFWRDTSVGIVGPSVAPLQRAFVRTWNYIGSGPGRTTHLSRAQTLHPEPANPRAFTVPTEGKHLALMAISPTLHSPLRPALHRILASARHSVRMTMAYFAPDDTLADALCSAARRGVKVQLMLPGVTDVRLLLVAQRAFYERMLAANVEVFERQAVVLHAKTLVIDDRISVIGSCNLDYRSIEYNLEICAIFTCPDFALQVSNLFDNDIRYSTRICAETWRKRHWRDRLAQWAVARTRYLL